MYYVVYMILVFSGFVLLENESFLYLHIYPPSFNREPIIVLVYISSNPIKYHLFSPSL